MSMMICLPVSLPVFWANKHVHIADCNPTEDGRLYTGHTTVTVTGKTCVSWTAQDAYENFTDGNRWEVENYCRNPDSDYSGLWCYTENNGHGREDCYVPTCGQSFVLLSTKICYKLKDYDTRALAHLDLPAASFNCKY